MPKYSQEWQKGFNDFIRSTFGDISEYEEETAPCPCTGCRCMSFRTEKEVRSHLVLRGFDESFIIGEGNGQAIVQKDVTITSRGDIDDECTEGDAAGARDLISSLISGAIHGELGNIDEVPMRMQKKIISY